MPSVSSDLRVRLARGPIAEKVPRATAEFTGCVAGVPYSTRFERQAAAPDASVELGAQELKTGDALVNVLGEALGQPSPVAFVRGALVGKRVELGADRNGIEYEVVSYTS